MINNPNSTERQQMSKPHTYRVRATRVLIIEATTSADALDVAQTATNYFEHMEGVTFEGGSYQVVNENEPIITSLDITFDEWLRYGWKQSWCGPAVCETHDGFPMSDAESDEFQNGDPCLHMLRLYDSPKHRQAIESAHAPTSWRTPKGWS